MNDENNNISNDKVKIEYVNPLNPNEILRSKDNININNATVENNANTNVENTNIDKENIDKNSEEIEISITKQKSKKILLVLIVLIVLAIIIGSILIIPKIFNNDKKPIITDEGKKEEEIKITLQDIISNSTNNTYYRLLTSIYNVNITINDNKIIFDLKSIDSLNEITKQFIFELENRNLKISFNKQEDNTDKLNALYAIYDSIAQYYGHEIDEAGNYLYSLNNDYNFDINGITVNSVDLQNIMIYIDLDTNVNTIELNSMYFTPAELTPFKDIIATSSTNFKKGDLLLYTTSTPTNTILIGERKNLTNNTYNTILSIIELLYPEEINDFKSKFTTLSTISFDKYRITIDPILDTYKEYQYNYKFILIEILNQV